MVVPDNIAPIDSSAWPEDEGWNLVRYMVDACHDLNRPDLIGQIRIEFSSTLRKTVGQARYIEKIVVLSRHYWAYLPEYEKRDTVIHEVCHLATPGSGHGREWKDAMMDCGVPPDRMMSRKASNIVKRKKRTRNGDIHKMWLNDVLTKTRYDAGLCEKCNKPICWMACTDGIPIRGLTDRYRMMHILVGECSFYTNGYSSWMGETNGAQILRDPDGDWYRVGRPETPRYVKTEDNWRGWKVEGT